MPHCSYEGADRGAHECPSCCPPHSKPGRRILGSALLGALVVLAVGGAAGDSSSLIGGLWDPDRASIAQDTRAHLGMTQRGAVEVGGASASGSAILAFDTPVPVGGRAPGGIRREIAVAADGAIAVTTSDDNLTVSVVDHLATAANGSSAAVVSEVMLVAGRGTPSGAVRLLATDETGGVAIQDSGADITVSGSTDAPFTQGGGAVGADTLRVTVATDDVVTVDGSAGAAVQQGAGASTAATLRMALATDANVVDTELPAAAALGDATANPTVPAVGAFMQLWNGASWDRLPGTTANGADVDVTRMSALVAGTATIGSVEVLGLAANGTRPALRMEADGTVIISGTVTTTLGSSTAAIGSVQVINGAGGLAVNVQDGGNSLTVDNAALAVTGGGVEATALRVTVATDSTGVLSVDDNAGSLTVDTAQLPAALVGGRLDVVVGAALPAGANNIGDVDVLTLPALIAGTATVGSVQILGLAADGTRPAVRTATDGTVRVDPTGTTAQPVTDNAGSLTVDAPLATPVAVRIGDTVDTANVTAAGELNVLASAQPGVDLGDVTLTASTALIGSVHAPPALDYAFVTSASFLVQTAFTNFVTAGAEERNIVAAQGAGISIIVLDWIVTTQNAVTATFEDAAGGTARSLPVRLGSDGAGWTSDHPAAWFETGDNQGLDLDLSGTMTGACYVRYVTR